MKHIRCAMCLHPKKHDIESELADGARLTAIARRYELSYDVLWRHWRNHVDQAAKDRMRFGDAPVHKLKGMVAEEGISVLKDLNFARKVLIEAIRAAPAQDANARASLTGRLHENARIRGSVTGELAKSPLVQQQTLNVFVNAPEYVAFQSQLLDALAPYSDAREAVIRVFERLEAAEASAAVGAVNPLPALEHNPNGE